MVFPDFLFQLLILIGIVSPAQIIAFVFCYENENIYKTAPSSSAARGESSVVLVMAFQVSVNTYNVTEFIHNLQLSSDFSVHSSLLRLAFHRDEVRCNMLPPGLFPSHRPSLLRQGYEHFFFCPLGRGVGIEVVF